MLSLPDKQFGHRCVIHSSTVCVSKLGAEKTKAGYQSDFKLNTWFQLVNNL